MGRYAVSLVLAIALSGLGAGAFAGVLYEQSPGDGLESLDATVFAPDFTGVQNADNFAIGPSQVTGFRWWGTDVSDTSGFVVRTFSDLTSAPTAHTGTVTKTGTLLTDSFGDAVYEFEISFAAVSMSGTRHLSILLDGDLLSPESWYWLASDDGDGTSVFRGFDGDSWAEDPPNLAFAVLGEQDVLSVPEPTTLALFALAGLGAMVARRSADPRTAVQTSARSSRADPISI